MEVGEEVEERASITAWSISFSSLLLVFVGLLLFVLLLEMVVLLVFVVLLVLVVLLVVLLLLLLLPSSRYTYSDRSL